MRGRALLLRRGGLVTRGLRLRVLGLLILRRRVLRLVVLRLSLLVLPGLALIITRSLVQAPASILRIASLLIAGGRFVPIKQAAEHVAKLASEGGQEFHGTDILRPRNRLAVLRLLLLGIGRRRGVARRPLILRRGLVGLLGRGLAGCDENAKSGCCQQGRQGVGLHVVKLS